MATSTSTSASTPNAMSRRALATAGAGAGLGLAAAGLGLDSAEAKRKGRQSGTVHVSADGAVRVEQTRVTIPRVSHASRFHPDGRGEIVKDHRELLPAPGKHIDYQFSGRTKEDVDVDAAGRGAFVPVAKAIRFRATGGSYDPDTGELILDGEVIGYTTDDEGTAAERDWVTWGASFAPCLLELLLIIFMF